MSLFIARTRPYGGRAGERNMHGRLTVDRVLVVSYSVMAYSVRLERPFRHDEEPDYAVQRLSILFEIRRPERLLFQQ